MTNTFPALNARLFEYRGHAIRVFFILQILSSIAGLFVLWIWAVNLRRAKPLVRAAGDSASSLTDRARIAAASAVVATAGATALLAYADDAGAPFKQRIFDLLIGGMTGWFLAWCVVAVLITRTARIMR